MVHINDCQNEKENKQDKLSISNNTDELMSLIYKEFTGCDKKHKTPPNKWQKAKNS